MKDIDPDLKHATQRAVRHIIPFALLMYILAFLDRVNVPRERRFCEAGVPAGHRHR
ncbi:hypothetical protein CNECB9_820007 [Cupriavidus necator]|uniref:Uncharacterized protein n=1 Tax=Cupriavidus necator TaxID=106590 RepID=A0A1K0IS49_CUPNE|nr:hypothetical protein CNECB9_820007 [Cupriavidus necator]